MDYVASRKGRSGFSLREIEMAAACASRHAALKREVMSALNVYAAVWTPGEDARDASNSIITIKRAIQTNLHIHTHIYTRIDKIYKPVFPSVFYYFFFYFNSRKEDIGGLQESVRRVLEVRRSSFSNS